MNTTTHNNQSQEAISPERALAWNLIKMEANGDQPPACASLPELTALLESRNKAVEDGDLSHVRRILSNQVTMLERLTDHLFSRALSMGAVADVYERYLRMAFRAQSLCLRTVALLKKMTDKVPPRTRSNTPQEGRNDPPIYNREAREPDQPPQEGEAWKRPEAVPMERTPQDGLSPSTRG